MSDLAWLDDDELRVFRAFARAARRVFDRFDQDLQRSVGMPRTYFEILWLLHDAPAGALRMSDLAAATSSQPSRISHAVRRLEEAGHVRREVCDFDRRGWFTVLTDEGRAALEAAAPCYAQSIRAHLLGRLSADEQRHLVAIGDLLLAGLDESSGLAPSEARGIPARRRATEAIPSRSRA